MSGSEDSSLRLWDAASGSLVGKPLAGHSGIVYSVAFSRPDGERLVSGSEDNTLRLWDAASGNPIGEPLTGHTKSVNSVAFSPDGQQIVSASDDRTLRLWHAATGALVGKPLTGHSHYVNSAAFSPDGRYIVSGQQGWRPASLGYPYRRACRCAAGGTHRVHLQRCFQPGWKERGFGK
ncbi:MAG: hypothetical protein IPL05_07975 [Betaproteobacteria bacterium]|nr:hypothetical protein [Betaproteobacteria bacterium]